MEEQGDYGVEHLAGNISEQADQAQDEYVLLDALYQEIGFFFRRDFDFRYDLFPGFLFNVAMISFGKFFHSY